MMIVTTRAVITEYLVADDSGCGSGAGDVVVGGGEVGGGRAHEWRPPRAMLVAVVMPETSTGVVREKAVPSPSWP